MIRGGELHVSRLSLDKGEVDIDGRIDSFTYSETAGYGAKGESYKRIPDNDFIKKHTDCGAKHREPPQCPVVLPVKHVENADPAGEPE